MKHAVEAERFNRDETRVNWHDEALWFVREKRDKAAAQVQRWEELRDVASAIKAHTMSRLDEYLVQFEQAAERNGARVHWADDAEAHNGIVSGILRERGVRRIVKSKSMLTEECGLNHELERQGIEVVDTDLGERIVQLAKEPPSHIVMPAIHKRRGEIDALFHELLGTRLSGGDAAYLAREARRHLREKFLSADASLTGANFAVAETGTVVVCTNEGNADMGVHATPLHIVSVGIEKVIPSLEHLGVFLRQLARSATGQPITSYTSWYRSPRPGAEMHIILVDNGRSRLLGRPEFRSALHCIRCGACMNTCPVYRRSGGFSYGAVIPGPIGSILAPGADPARFGELPFASTLCGSCSTVCPVKIDIHGQLYRWRQELDPKLHASPWKRCIMRGAATVFAHPRIFLAVSGTGRVLLRLLPRFLIRTLSPWGRQREFPSSPAATFAQWHRARRER